MENCLLDPPVTCTKKAGRVLRRWHKAGRLHGVFYFSHIKGCCWFQQQPLMKWVKLTGLISGLLKLEMVQCDIGLWSMPAANSELQPNLPRLFLFLPSAFKMQRPSYPNIAKLSVTLYSRYVTREQILRSATSLCIGW